MPDPAAKTEQQSPQVQWPPQDNAITQNIVARQVPTQDNPNKLEVTLVFSITLYSLLSCF